jgi:hypothetical protein
MVAWVIKKGGQAQRQGILPAPPEFWERLLKETDIADPVVHVQGQEGGCVKRERHKQWR